VHRDISDRKRMQAQLLLTDRLASVGTLAAGVAHEINNPLAYIGANLSWIRRRLEALGPALGEGQAELVGALTDCQEGAERIRTIVQDLKTYSSHDADAQVGPLDVNTVLEFAIRVSDNEVRQRARLVRELTAGLPRVSGGHARLGQVFLDLLVNASQAIASGGQNENEVRVRSRLDGEMVLVEVEDTGSGIPPEVLPRIFDPFFTTKPVGGGTGLGLFICHGIITGMGGRIAAESQPGRGTTFRVWLPPAAPPQPTPAPTRPRVLVVDDEPLLGLSIQRLLSPAQEVVVETSPEAALRRVVGGERFDVAMLDMVMPGMNGLELHARLREVAPSLAARTVFVFGGTLEPGVEAALDRLGAPRVSKPFDLRQLAEVVAALLAGGPARG
jgi:nitrogen-specific signal transduction histidine kinase/CheY-like chemotaxis protein